MYSLVICNRVEGTSSKMIVAWWYLVKMFSFSSRFRIWPSLALWPFLWIAPGLWTFNLHKIWNEFSNFFWAVTVSSDVKFNKISANDLILAYLFNKEYKALIVGLLSSHKAISFLKNFTRKIDLVAALFVRIVFMFPERKS